MTITNVIQIIMALGLLLVGRKLYWVFVGAIGFISVTEWAFAHLQNVPEGVVLIIGIAVGMIGALLAIFLRAVGIGLAGFLGGAYIFMIFSSMLSITNQSLELGLTIVGGILGLIFVLKLFDWALILISSISGAALLSKFVPITRVNDAIWVAILAVIGIVVQARELKS